MFYDTNQDNTCVSALTKVRITCSLSKGDVVDRSGEMRDSVSDPDRRPNVIILRTTDFPLNYVEN